MKRNRVDKKILWLVCSLLLLLVQCRLLEFDKGHQDIWNSNKKGADDPVITGVAPDSLVGGNAEVTLTGQNFSPIVEENFVYFGDASGKQMGVVKTASETQLTVFRPLDVTGSITIELAVRDAYLTSQYSPYYLEPGNIQYPIDQLGRANAITVDNDGNIYAQSATGQKPVYMITPGGTQSEYGTVDNFNASAMRMGSGGYLYIQKNDNKDLYRIAPGGGAAEKFATISRKVSYFDFDENGNIYSGGAKDGLFFTKSDGTGSISVANYKLLDIKAVRIFEGFVYVAVSDIEQGGIWRNQILTSDGTLGANELVYNWSNSGEYASLEINDFTFSDDGDIYIGIETGLLDPVLIVHPASGTTEKLYSGTISGPVTQLCWGSEMYLYINRLGLANTNSSISRLVMGKAGAVYYGR